MRDLLPFRLVMPRRTAMLLVAVTALFAAACGAGPAATSQPTTQPAATQPASSRPASTQPASSRPAGQAVVDIDDVNTFRTYVTDLAAPEMEGRGPGTRGLDDAARYIRTRFESYGLLPGIRERKQAEASFRQPFEISVGLDPRNQALAVRADGVGELKPGVDFSALGFSQNGSFEGPMVFVGYGIESKDHDYDSYDGDALDKVKGAVVVVFRYEPQDEDGKSKWAEEGRGQWTSAAGLVRKARWATDNGAAAILLVTPPKQQAETERLRTARGTDARGSRTVPAMHISAELFAQIIKAGGGDVTPQSLQELADASDETIIPLEGVTASGNVELERVQAGVENVVGLLPGHGDLADEVIVVGAHYDHLGMGEFGSLSGERAIHHGADDNASGTAGLLMLARRAAERDQTLGDQPRRSLLFMAFSGEERGLLGSAYFIKTLKDGVLGDRKIVAMLNMDMIGRVQNDKVYVLGTGSGKEWADIVKEQAEGLALSLVTNSSPVGASDHASFFTAGVPAVHFFSGSHEDYHRPSDTADKINARGGAIIVDLVDRVMQHLRTRADNITFDKSKANMHGSTRFAGGGAFLGIMPDYATMDGDAGCGLTGVTPGSPAEKAGLKPGDIIVKWNGKQVRNVQDLTGFLGEASPGDRVKMTVKRDRQLLPMTVKLGRR